MSSGKQQVRRSIDYRMCKLHSSKMQDVMRSMIVSHLGTLHLSLVWAVFEMIWSVLISEMVVLPTNNKHAKGAKVHLDVAPLVHIRPELDVSSWSRYSQGNGTYSH